MANLSIISGRVVVRTVNQTAKLLGVGLPAELASELTRANDLISRAEAISGADLNGAVLDALADGRDHHTDAAVQALLLDHVLVAGNIGGAAHERADFQIKQALVENADTVLSGWAEALAPHSDALAAAVDGLPTFDLSDTGPIAARGAEAMDHWKNAQEGLKRWDAAVDGFNMIASSAQINVSGDNKLLVMTPADTAALERVRVAVRSDAKPNAWLLAQHGVTLVFATLADYTERVAEAQQQRALAAQAAEGNRKRASGDTIKREAAAI